MQEAAALLTSWQTFYVIVGAAAATLTGLMFVATTLLDRVPTRASAELRAGFEAFATPTLVQLAMPLLVAAILSAPWPALWQAGLMLVLVGLGGAALIVIAVRWGRRQADYQTKLGDWLWYRTFPLVAYVALIVAGIVLRGSPVPAMFVIGGVTVALLFIGIRNAWDSITFLAIERARPEDKSQDQAGS